MVLFFFQQGVLIMEVDMMQIDAVNVCVESESKKGCIVYDPEREVELDGFTDMYC